MQVESISSEGKNVIRHYANIRFTDDKLVRCPYYRNPRSGERKWGLIVFSGKGSPSDIEEELQMITKLEGIDPISATEKEIVTLMRKYRLGIDCAGFVFHVLNADCQKKKNKSLLKMLKPHSSLASRHLAWYFRPLTQVSVRLLTSHKNAREIKESEIRPGDIIAFFAEIDHVLVITDVTRENEIVTEIKYAHAAYEKDKGTIKEGTARYTEEQTFIRAKLTETPDTGRVVTDGRNTPHFFRLKYLT